MIIVVPKNAPVIQNLHSYYVDVRKLVEHYQGHDVEQKRASLAALERSLLAEVSSGDD